MALEFQWDQRDKHRIRYTKQGIEITRGCMVRGVTVTENMDGTDPEVWVRVLTDTNCPVPGIATYPSTAALFSAAVLDELVPASVGPSQPNSWVRMDAVYRTIVPSGGGGTGSGAWTVTDSTVTEFAPCYATSAGGAALTVWYKRGESSATTVFPGTDAAHGSVLKGVNGIHRLVPRRHLRVTGLLLAADWNGIKATVRAAAGKIHSDTWGSYTRGQWLFLGPVTRTSDLGRSFNVELDFAYDPNGHYPIGVYFDEHGQHPADSATEADLRTGGPPPVNTYKGRNGIMMASVYPETAFSSLFSFTPG